MIHWEQTRDRVTLEMSGQEARVLSALLGSLGPDIESIMATWPGLTPYFLRGQAVSLTRLYLALAPIEQAINARASRAEADARCIRNATPSPYWGGVVHE